MKLVEVRRMNPNSSPLPAESEMDSDGTHMHKL